MKGWAWAALVLIISAIVLTVKFMNPQMASKSGDIDPTAFNSEIYQAYKRREDWSMYPLAVARRFASKQCECTDRQVEQSTAGVNTGSNTLRITVTDAEIPHKMRGHVYRIDIENQRGALRIVKATREWLPWSDKSAPE